MMSNKIAVGIINTTDEKTFNICKKSVESADYIFSVHNGPGAVTNAGSLNYNRYISYGGLYNILLRNIEKTDATYAFLIHSNLCIDNGAIFREYIDTAKAFGTWFMTRGDRSESPTTIEDDNKNINLNLYENVTQGLIFMPTSYLRHIGYFNESYINFNVKKEINCLEIYDYYNRVINKIDYLPLGYFPDAENSTVRISEINCINTRTYCKNINNNAVTKLYGQFFYKNKFIPGRHKTASKEEALTKLEKIQKIYSIND